MFVFTHTHTHTHTYMHTHTFFCCAQYFPSNLHSWLVEWSTNFEDKILTLIRGKVVWGWAGGGGGTCADSQSASKSKYIIYSWHLLFVSNRPPAGKEIHRQRGKRTRERYIFDTEHPWLKNKGKSIVNIALDQGMKNAKILHLKISVEQKMPFSPYHLPLTKKQNKKNPNNNLENNTKQTYEYNKRNIYDFWTSLWPTTNRDRCTLSLAAGRRMDSWDQGGGGGGKWGIQENMHNDPSIYRLEWLSLHKKSSSSFTDTNLWDKYSCKTHWHFLVMTKKIVWMDYEWFGNEHIKQI